MMWAYFYLACFALGFTLSLVSFVAGGFRWHLHLPHFPTHVPTHLGGAHPHAGGAKGVGAGHVSPFNFASLAAFLAWFGGIGYLLTRFSTLWFVTALGVAVVGGITGGAIVFMFLSRVLMSENENLDPADFDMAGVLGRTSVPVRAGGTGEIIYSQAGTRRTCGARSESGCAIPKGCEVMVTRYEKGIAYVRLWSEISEEETASPAPDGAQSHETDDTH